MLEDRLAIWDEAEANLTFASGMAAISTTLWAYARPGSVIVHSGPVYGGTDFLLKRILPQFGVTSVEFPAESGTKAMEEAVNRARAIGPIAAIYSRRRPIRPTALSTSAAPERSAMAWGEDESARSSSSTIRCSDPCTRRRWRTGPICGDVAHQICRRPFRSDRRRLLGRGACARADPRHAHDLGTMPIPTPAGC